MAKRITGLVLRDGDRTRLNRYLRSGSTSHRLHRRARAILMMADGRALRAVAEALSASVASVTIWRNLYREGGVEALVQPNRWPKS